MSTTKEPTVIDKAAWGEGPWLTEPDRAEWEHAGVPCLAVRHPRSGHWCGYAAVSPGHPLHGQSYDSPDVNVHGGLTYARACNDAICHMPKPGEPDNVWWFGFDCAHAGDYSPGYDNHRYRAEQRPYNHDRAVALHALSWSASDVYRTLDYVTDETNRLAERLVELGATSPAVDPHAGGTRV